MKTRGSERVEPGAGSHHDEEQNGEERQVDPRAARRVDAITRPDPDRAGEDVNPRGNDERQDHDASAIPRTKSQHGG